MAWTAPRTWVAGETLTAALMNTHVRDNLNWLENDSPRCGALRDTNQSIPNSSLTTISYTGTDEFDVGAMHDPGGGNPSRLTVPSGGGGIYLCISTVTWAATGSATNVELQFYKNGVAVASGKDTSPANTGGASNQGITLMMPLVATDFIESKVFHTAGAAVNVTRSVLQLFRLGA